MIHEYSTPYCVQNDNYDRVVIHGNDTDIIIIIIIIIISSMPLLYSNPAEIPSRAKCITSCPSNRISTGARTVSLPYPLSIAYCKWPRHQHSLASRHSSRPAYVQISLVLKSLVKTIRIPSQMTSSIRHETSQLLYLSKADHPKDFE